MLWLIQLNGKNIFQIAENVFKKYFFLVIYFVKPREEFRS